MNRTRLSTVSLLSSGGRRETSHFCGPIRYWYEVIFAPEGTWGNGTKVIQVSFYQLERSGRERSERHLSGEILVVYTSYIPWYILCIQRDETCCQRRL